LKRNKLIFKGVWLIRRMVGITPNDLQLRYHKKRQWEIIDHYLNHNEIKKLQIGCQSQLLDDWLNVDLQPKDDRVAFMDATEPFPSQDHVFDYVFSEHMIEHITFTQGLFMLRECYRVLKPGGKIRIATPNLQFLISLYKEPKTPIQNKYVETSIRRYFKEEVPVMDTLVINNFFRDWGHQFIYDEKALRYVMKEAGFKDITVCQINESTDIHLRNLEKHGLEISNDFNELETLVMEARK